MIGGVKMMVGGAEMMVGGLERLAGGEEMVGGGAEMMAGGGEVWLVGKRWWRMELMVGGEETMLVLRCDSDFAMKNWGQRSLACDLAHLFLYGINICAVWRRVRLILCSVWAQAVVAVDFSVRIV